MKADMTKDEIIKALARSGISIAQLARTYGIHRNNFYFAMRQPFPKSERRIADALGMNPWDIWPSRYEGDAPKNRTRLGDDHPVSKAFAALREQRQAQS